MKQKITLLLLVGLSLTCNKTLQAKEAKEARSRPEVRVMASCAPATSRTNISINTVRFTVMGGGDKWAFVSATNNRGFEYPANSGKSMVSGGSLWLAAKDDNQVLHVAAQTYRQFTTLGIGFWPGPLGIANNLGIDSVSCRLYDRIWQVTKAQVDLHKTQFNQPGYQTPMDIAQWPANGRVTFNESLYLAPFADLNGNALYEPQLGEYPLIAGDAASWHVYNALGGIAGSGSPPMGLEIQEENFAFAGPTLLEQAAFFRLKIINRSNRTYDSVYTGVFIDPDIGGGNDDYIGCDVSRNLGFAYNSDAEDGGSEGYGINPPVFGLLQLEGPFATSNDGLDNDRDGQIDEITADCTGRPLPERIAMTSFLTFNNNSTLSGNPRQARHVMQYLSGAWLDGSKMTFGGTAYLGSLGSTHVPYTFAYPGSSDPTGWGYVYAGGVATAPPFSWTENQPGGIALPNMPSDRRFVMSNGKTQMLPGAVQVLMYAGMWGRDSVSSDSTAAFNRLLAVSDYVQQQYNNCFLAIPDVIFTSTANVKAPLNWTLYPNPVENGRLYVKGDFDLNKAIHLQLIDMQGRKHPLEITDLNAGRLNLYTPAKTGLYLIEIRQGDQRMQQKLFIR